MKFKLGFLGVAAAVLAFGALSVGAAGAETPRGRTDDSDYQVAAAYEDGSGVMSDFEAGNVRPVAQACETGPTSTTCVAKGWLAGKVCGWLGGEIVAGDPNDGDGVFLCEKPNPA